MVLVWYNVFRTTINFLGRCKICCIVSRESKQYGRQRHAAGDMLFVVVVGFDLEVNRSDKLDLLTQQGSCRNFFYLQKFSRQQQSQQMRNLSNQVLHFYSMRRSYSFHWTKQISRTKKLSQERGACQANQVHHVTRNGISRGFHVFLPVAPTEELPVWSDILTIHVDPYRESSFQ